MNIRKTVFATILCMMGFTLYLNSNNFSNRRSPLQLCEREVSNSEEPSEPNMNATINILLLAYPRSGSTFTGELLSNGDDVFYLFEPSYEFTLARKITDADKIIEILDGIYNCKNESLQMFAANHVGSEEFGFIYPKAPKGNPNNYANLTNVCKSSRVIIIKTVRLPMEVAHQLVLTKPSLNLRIVHLVRDPRAMLNSLKQKSFWSNVTMNKALNCDNLRKDLKVSESIPRENYIRIRYEDLYENVLKTTAGLYASIGLQLTDSLASYIAQHTKALTNENMDKTGKYFSTFRNKNFDPSHWKSSLKLKDIIHLETACKDVIEELNYGFTENNSILNQ